MPVETLLSVKAVAQRARCSREAIYNAIRDGKISAVTIAGRYLISESETERFIREWPVRSNGHAVAARWAEFRQWKAERCAAAMEAA